jgi:hypothetical protein
MPCPRLPLLLPCVRLQSNLLNSAWEGPGCAVGVRAGRRVVVVGGRQGVRGDVVEAPLERHGGREEWPGGREYIQRLRPGRVFVGKVRESWWPGGLVARGHVIPDGV